MFLGQEQRKPKKNKNLLAIGWFENQKLYLQRPIESQDFFESRAIYFVRSRQIPKGQRTQLLPVLKKSFSQLATTTPNKSPTAVDQHRPPNILAATCYHRPAITQVSTYQQSMIFSPKEILICSQSVRKAGYSSI